MPSGEVRAGHTTTELFASGGVHALVRLLDNVLEYAREPQRSVWVREVLALLYPLVRRSRMVARLLVSLAPNQSALSGCRYALLSDCAGLASNQERMLGSSKSCTATIEVPRLSDEPACQHSMVAFLLLKSMSSLLLHSTQDCGPDGNAILLPCVHSSVSKCCLQIKKTCMQ